MADFITSRGWTGTWVRQLSIRGQAYGHYFYTNDFIAAGEINDKLVFSQSRLRSSGPTNLSTSAALEKLSSLKIMLTFRGNFVIYRRGKILSNNAKQCSLTRKD
jgi:hypothetical protein